MKAASVGEYVVFLSADKDISSAVDWCNLTFNPRPRVIHGCWIVGFYFTSREHAEWFRLAFSELTWAYRYDAAFCFTGFFPDC